MTTYIYTPNLILTDIYQQTAQYLDFEWKSVEHASVGGTECDNGLMHVHRL